MRPYMKVDRSFRVTIYADGYADGGEPYTDDELDLIEEDQVPAPMTEVMQILEHRCPTCENEMWVTEVGGYAEFIEEFFPETALDERYVWEEGDERGVDSGTVLGVSYSCPFEHDWYIERSASGEWVR